MITVAILDDNAAEAERIRELAHRFFSSQARPAAVQAFTDPFGLLELADKSGGFDLYLLDILMPHMSGIELAEKLRERRERCEIVFLTSSREYGAEAFGVSAAGYLLKPVAEKPFFELCGRLLQKISAAAHPPLLVKTAGGMRRVAVEDIVLIESFNHRREVRLAGGEKLETPVTLARFAEMLKDCPAFYAPHRAYIVNLDYVSGLRGSDILIGGVTVPIAKGALPKFKTYFFQYTFRE